MEITCREKILSNEYADWLIDFELTKQLAKLDASGVDYCYEKIDDALGIVYAKREQMEELGILNYSYQQIPSVFAIPKVTLEENLATFDASDLVSTGSAALQQGPLGLTGKNTVIAFIGTGIDYTSPLFRRDDGSSRILSIWDQTIQKGTPPATASYGSEYTREEINRALLLENPFELVPTKDEAGFTTYVAGVAAGSRITLPEAYAGAAPEADIVIIKLKECKNYLREYYLLPDGVSAYQSTDIIKALEYADSFGLEFFCPVIFCFTLGTNYGSHSGTSALSLYLERLGRKRGRVAVISGGEEGNKAHHYSGRFKEGEIREREEIEISVGEQEKGFVMEVWGKLPGSYRVGIRAPSGQQLQVDPVIREGGRAYQFIYERTKITVSYAAVDPVTGDQLIILRVERPVRGIWTLLLEGDNTFAGEYHVWLPCTDFLSSDTYFLKPDPDITLTVPSYTTNAISTSSYATKTGSFYAQGGRGFSRDGFVKPDLAAPGVGISTPLKSLPSQLRVGQQTCTAFSAAFTAGAVAQFLQWAYEDGGRNYLNGNEIKSFFLQAAEREEIRSYPNREWGYGTLSLEQVFDRLVQENSY